MTPTLNFCRTLLLGLGLATSIVNVARCDDPADASRDSIIQGVRDDVRRKIREREANSPAARPDARTMDEGAAAGAQRQRKSRKKHSN